MRILILVLSIIFIIALICKYFKFIKKGVIIISISFAVIGMAIFLIDKFDVFQKIAYKIYESQPTITQSEREQAVAKVEYSNIIGIDAASYESYYIYKNKENKYYYFKTSSNITVSGAGEEKINKKGNINSKEKLEKIISSFDKRIDFQNLSNIKSFPANITHGQYIEITYNGVNVSKEELLNKLFG